MDVLDLAQNPRKANQRFSPFTKDLPDGMVKRLEYVFGDRATADENERAVAASDGSSVPHTINSALKRTPWAVVLPQNRGDLFEIIQFATENFVPVVPRGGGTSLCGGSVPTEGGVTVDMRLMRGVLGIDADGLTVTAEPGIRLWDLERKLNAEGLALRQYPPTAKGATLGGLAAQGGGGIGSLKYGGFREDVVSVDVIGPDGELRHLEGDDLDLVVGAWGTTGFIVEVTLRVRRFEPITPFLAQFDDVEAAAKAASRLAGAGGYHLEFHSAEDAELTNEAMDGRPLPNKTSILWCVDGDVVGADGRFQAVVEDAGGTLAKAGQADLAWAARFAPDAAKALGPSLVRADAVVDVAKLGHAYVAGMEAGHAERQAIRGMTVNGREMVLTYYALDDERRVAFAFGNALAFIDAMKDLGGRVANTGVYFAGEAKHVLGSARLKRLARFKREIDPNDIFNPGPVFGARPRGLPMKAFPTIQKVGKPFLKMVRRSFYMGGGRFDPSFHAVARTLGGPYARLLRPVDWDVHAMSAAGHEDLDAPETGFVEWETSRPRGRVLAARAILEGRTQPTEHLLREASRAPITRSAEASSPTHTPVNRITDLLLAACVDRLGPLPGHAALAANVEKEGNVHGKPRDDRVKWQEGLPFAPDSRVLFYAGDDAAYLVKDVAQHAVRAIVNADARVATLGKDEGTDTALLVETGQREAARAALEPVFKALAGRTLDTILTPDANAWRVMTYYWPEFARDLGHPWNLKVEHTTTVLADLVKAKRLEFETQLGKKVAYHAPEALGRDLDDDAMKVLEALGADIVDAPHVDCGHGRGTHLIEHDPKQTLVANPLEMRQQIAERVLRTAIDAGAEAIVTANPGCFLLLQEAAKKAKADVEVLDLHALVAEHMKVREGGAPVAAPVVTEEPAAAAEPEIPPGHHRVEFVKEGIVLAVDENTNILDAGEEAGMELPSSCRAGSCDTCSARWEGTPADQAAGEALTEDQQKTFVLTCIARPKGPIKIWSDERP